MRDGLHPATDPVPEQELERIRAFLDGQSRVDLAVWVLHEQQGGDGPVYDHHLVLGIADDDYASCDAWALEIGIEIPQPGWLDIYPLSEVEELRSFGTVLWERGERPRGGDPLDFRLTWEPLRLDADVRESFARLVSARGGVARIEGATERLWKNGAEVWQKTQLYLGFAERRPRDFEQIQSAAKEAGITVNGMSAGLPTSPRVQTATLYEAAA